MAEKRDFLLEIGCEEMPSAPLMNAQKQLSVLAQKGLERAGLEHGEITTLSTPRRLTLIVSDCATTTKEVHETLRGPQTTIAFDEQEAPTKAAIGFARKCGIEPKELVRKFDADGKEYVFAEIHIASRDAKTLLSELSETIIASLEWPNYRSQRWGSEHATFVRPIRWICSLLGEELVDVHYADVQSSNTTLGHRVLAPGEHVVSSSRDYEAVLENAYVLGEIARANKLRESLTELEQQLGGAHIDTPQRIFDEVVNLCEWPTVLMGSFDEEFLEVPHEIICESMLSHQRYFPIYDVKGNLTRNFVIVSNADPAYSNTVITGNERVVRARLEDAKFFYEEDLKQPLEAYVEKLKEVVFQEDLGTTYQKVERMEALAAKCSTLAGGSALEVADALRAAHLAKADLVTSAVVEFTNQQGVMGGYYASASQENETVSRAIREHYRPRFAGDTLPIDLCGKSVAIADKLDTVCGIFAINEPPTGSSDPYAVRRCAIGVIAMLRELPSVSLDELINCSIEAYKNQGLSFDVAEVTQKVRSYFAGRLGAIAREEGISPDTIEAVSSTNVIDPVAFLSRTRALEKARKDNPELFEDLATAYARAANLADESLGIDCDTSIMNDAELSLFTACEHGQDKVDELLNNGDYDLALKSLADLREPIDRFFIDVLVMDEDTTIRENRLKLLNRFERVFKGVANIGVLARKK